MEKNTDILNELKELGSSLAHSSNLSVYSVPGGYFENFPAEMLRMVQLVTENESSPALQSISKQMLFSVPEGYFEQLPASIMSKIKAAENPVSAAEELATLSPLLNGIGKKMPYSLPDNYFEKSSIPQPGVPQRVAETKVVKMTRNSWMRFAAAAILIGFFAISGVFYFNRPAKIDPSKDPQAWLKKNIKTISTNELESFIELSDIETAALEPSTKSPVKVNDIKELMQDVPDNEIQKFLKETSTGDEENDILLN